MVIQRPSGVVEPLPLVVLRTGQTPVRQTEPCAGVWRVEAGVLRATFVTPEGRELWLDLLGPGDLVGGQPGVPAPWSVTALRPCRLVAAPAHEAREVLAHHAARLAATASDIAWLDVPTRIDRRLRDLADRVGTPTPGGTILPFRLRQDDLAALAGTTRESANRAVRALVDAGRLAQPSRGRYLIRPMLRSVPA
jgi:CRP-like cAMP-binding protein